MAHAADGPFNDLNIDLNVHHSLVAARRPFTPDLLVTFPIREDPEDQKIFCLPCGSCSGVFTAKPALLISILALGFYNPISSFHLLLKVVLIFL